MQNSPGIGPASVAAASSRNRPASVSRRRHLAQRQPQRPVGEACQRTGRRIKVPDSAEIAEGGQEVQVALADPERVRNWPAVRPGEDRVQAALGFRA